MICFYFPIYGQERFKGEVASFSVNAKYHKLTAECADRPIYQILYVVHRTSLCVYEGNGSNILTGLRVHEETELILVNLKAKKIKLYNLVAGLFHFWHI